jgi:glycosyltransferase involved in cell wall biosynthesis
VVSLNVVHFSTADNDGGSARSAYRIHTGLRALGANSRMLVGNRVTEDPDVECLYRGRLDAFAGRMLDAGMRKAGLLYQWSQTGARIRRHPWVSSANIFQIYNTHGGYFPTPLLTELSRHAPIVWRLSDLFPITGHCVYPGECEKWMTGCMGCPDLVTYVPIGIDTAAWLWRQKRRLFGACDITLVAPSSWTEAMARRSPLTRMLRIERIPNGLDTSIFSPSDRRAACTELGLDPKLRRVLFVAHGLDNNPRKGGPALIGALKLLSDRANIELVLAGSGGHSWVGHVPVPVRLMGYITDDKRMANIYRASDLIVAPSAVENLPNTVLEAMACGTPAVAFDVGGMKDAVRTGETGYLARLGDTAGLAQGMDLLLEDASLRNRWSIGSRRLIETEFSQDRQARCFLNLYREIIEERRTGRVSMPA